MYHDYQSIISTETYFDDIEFEIKRLLKLSKSSVRICVAWINGEIYTSILENLGRNNIKIEIIYNNDHTNLKHGIPESPYYKCYPIDTRLSSSLMHNKFCIIDEEIVMTGSFNWSCKAKDSFENIVVIKNDFKLVKNFLHEFYDLISYYRGFSSSSLMKCDCRSNIYNLAILGSESGKYDDSKIDVWRICVKNQHILHIGEEYEQYLQTHLGMKDAPDWDDEYYDKDCMINEFKQERRQIESLQNYFNDRDGNMKIHAVGVIRELNWNEHIEYDEELEYSITMIWRDMYYRKIIPDVLYSDGDEIDKIIDNSL